MTVTKNISENDYLVKIDGRLDTTTAPQLEDELRPLYAIADSLTLDFEKLDYISSAGLRILLISQKEMSKEGKIFAIKNVNSAISDVLEITGFCGIITIL